MIARGNQKSLNDNVDLIIETMNKEERYSHVIPIHSYLCRFGPSCQHVPQGLNLRKGKKRLISDCTTKLHPDDLVVNEITSILGEPEITFGQTKMKLLKHLYNTRISEPHKEILGAYVDVKACFRYIRYVPELAGVFGFIMDSVGHYYFAPAGVFGWKGSCNVWEPFRRAIEVMTGVVYEELTAKGDIELHSDLLDQISWSDPNLDESDFVRAVPDTLNQGVFDANGEQRRIPSHMFVDDAIVITI